MARQKNLNREFNRLYGNLDELHRRVFSDDYRYPKELCAEWFVSTLSEIVSVEGLNVRLNDDQVEHVLTLSKQIIRTKYLVNNDKSVLANLIRTLNATKVSENQVNAR